jgi:hypothetical protein
MKLRSAVFVFTILVSARAFAAAPPSQFSAEMVSNTGGQTMQAKLYVGDHKSRVEMPQAIMIMRMDRNVTYMIMPEQNMYMEQALDPKMMAQASQEVAGQVDRKSLGRESVNGVSAEKFLVTYETQGRRNEMYQWMGDNGVPVKVSAVDGSWSAEYRNVSVGPQPDSLFEVPAGYQKFAMPNASEMMRQAQQQE